MFRLTAALGIAAFVVGCSGSPVTSPTPALTPIASTQPTVTAPPNTFVAPRQTPSATEMASLPAASGIPSLTVDIHCLDERWAKPTGPSAATDGAEIVWPAISGSDPQGQPYLATVVAFRPASDPQPLVVYQAPEPDTMIWIVAVRDGHYAFVEMNDRVFGPGGWRIMLVPARGANAVLIDKSDGVDGPVPGIALSDHSVVWTAVHRKSNGLTYQLTQMGFGATDTHVIDGADVNVRQFWFPSVDPVTGRLYYSTVEPSGPDFRFGLRSVDLNDPAGLPALLADAGDATQPAAYGGVLTWRDVNDNVLNGSNTVVVANDQGGAQLPIALSRVTNLSIGSRYLTFNEGLGNDLLLYDLRAHQLVSVERHPADLSTEFSEDWTLVGADLLVFRRTHEDKNADPVGPAEVCWAYLPQ